MPRRFDYLEGIRERWGIRDKTIAMAWNLFLRVLAIEELKQGTPQQLEVAKEAFLRYMGDHGLVMMDEEDFERPEKYSIAYEDKDDQVLYVLDLQEVRGFLGHLPRPPPKSGPQEVEGPKPPSHDGGSPAQE